jgi:DNA-binding transcriptional MerR regulator
MAPRLTVDELARQAGTTTRNVRAHQTRGLLPGPSVVGRTGYYDEHHLARLRLIERLQERGFSLAAVAELLRAWEEGRSLSGLLGFEEALTAPWTDEVAVAMSARDLAIMFPGLTAEHRQAAVDGGVVIAEGDGFRVPSPAMLRIGAELLSLGIPIEAVLSQAADLREQLDKVAGGFVRLFERHVWEPFVRTGMPETELRGVTEVLNRLRPVAAAAVAAAFAQSMERTVTDAISDQLGPRSAVPQLPEAG